jgi:hypothetical protein
MTGLGLSPSIVRVPYPGGDAGQPLSCPLRYRKAERKGRTRAEVDVVTTGRDKLVGEFARGKKMASVLRE